LSAAAGRTGPQEETATPEAVLTSVLKALARDDPGAAVASLDGQLHHGRPGLPAALRQQVGEKLAAALVSHPGRLHRWIETLSASSSPTGRQVACLLLAERYPQDREGVLKAAETLADDPHWEVREAAGGLLGTLLIEDFERVKSRLESLRFSRLENLRRAVVLAAKYGARRDRPERVDALLSLLEPLLRDPTPYVRRNLGSFAIGDGFLRVDPKTTLKRLSQWSRDRDQMVRWNVAMAFTSAIGSFHWPAAKVVLERLATSPEPLVQMAVAKAVRRCRQRYPDDVEDTLRHWMRDRERVSTARLVGRARA
jgi:hypothetical protein